ncbi:MAG: DUF362 domain-containing protein [Deltaproteobacteria bacterium]|nr:DUF362 domain-containing protein [Deltaproteobacteria bacterium]
MNTPSRFPPRSRVSAIRLDSYEKDAVNQAMERLLDPLGGIERFVKTDAPVVLKPNFLAPRSVDKAVCTHPEVIRAAAHLVRKAGAAKIIVTDSPGVGNARRCAKRIGLVDDDSFTVENAEDGIYLDRPETGFHHLRLSRRIVEAGTVINLAKAKTHGKTVITAAVKNTFGAMLGMEKAQWHLRIGKELRPFAELIVHIHSLVAPSLSILDAVVGMEGNGPGSGDPRPLGILLASDNAHAVDAIFCRVIGLGPKEVPTLAVAQDLGLLGPIDEIEVVGDSIGDIQPNPPWRMARIGTTERILSSGLINNLLDRFLSLKPAVNQKKCTACGQCEEICAAKVITINKKAKPPAPRMIIDDKRCISCFCCQEICPEGAIRVKAGLGARILGLGTR